MAFYFFTELNKLNTQIEQNSYGYVRVDNDKENFNLQNKFSLTENSSAFSVTKSLVFFQQNIENSNLLNVVLFPIESNFTAGFPVKFFVYRGISKESLLKENNEIQLMDSSWSENNILQIIHKNQEEINKKNETTNIADYKSLGLDFDGLDETIKLESILFDFTDSFHPLIVPGGCEIGKFLGGDSLISVEVVLDKIGTEIDLKFLRQNENILQVNTFSIDNSLSEKEKKRKVFENRAQREKILAFMDITAFYGACINQNYEIKGVGFNSTDFISTFYNSKTVYIDIRDERGFSFNHFLNLNDTINIGFYNDQNEIEYTTTNYYENWPILKITDKPYNSDKKEFFIKLPITAGMPEVANVITAYTKKISLKNDSINKKYRLLTQQDVHGNISLKESEPIKLVNWDTSSEMASNYFLLKIDRITFKDKGDALHTIWDSFFSLDMKNIFSNGDISEGEFRLKTYSSINAPIHVSKDLSEMYSPNIGIAFDKQHVTFFSFPDEQVYKEDYTNALVASSLVLTGKYNYAFDSSNLVYDGDQTVGFLYQMITNKMSGLELSQFNINDTDNGISDSKFLLVQKNENNNYEEFLEEFDSITLTHEEYNALLNKIDEAITDEDYIANHPYFIKGNNNKKYDYEQITYLETKLTIGVPKIVNTYEENYSIIITEHPTEVKVSNENVILTSAITN